MATFKFNAFHETENVMQQQHHHQQLSMKESKVFGAALVTSNATSLRSIHATSTTTTTTTTTTSSQVASLLSNIPIASSRNALGDIGNKLVINGGGGVQLVKKQGEILGDATIKKDRQEVQQQVVPAAAAAPLACVEDEEQMMESSVMECSSTTEIIDIDEFDFENTQLCSDYVKDIYSYLIEMERRFRIKPNFLEDKTVTAKMRSVLIDWLVQVHNKFHLLQETLYLCIQIIDAYLQAQNVQKMELQLVGVTAMFLASKYEEMYVPAIDDFVYMTDNTYTKAEIRQMEISILKTLNFMLGKPLPLHFLRRYSKAGQADPRQHTMAKYFMEQSLHDAEFSCWDPSFLAASSLCLAFKLCDNQPWSRQMEYYSTYKESTLVPGMQKIASLLAKVSNSEYKYKAVSNKYMTSRLMRISLAPELGGQIMKQYTK